VIAFEFILINVRKSDPGREVNRGKCMDENLML
jgi:hypothetical protein